MMAWEQDNQDMTLLIQRRSLGNGRYEYKLHPFFRRNDYQAGVFLSPLSMLMFENSMLTFDRIEFVDTMGGQEVRDGDTALAGGDYWQRLSLSTLV